MQKHKKNKHKTSAEIRMSLVTIASLILVGLFLLVAIKLGGKIGFILSKDSPTQGATIVSDIVNQLHFLDGAPSGNVLYNPVKLSEDDIFLFFSAGKNSIQLKQTSDDTLQLEFARPNLEACNGTSCICHCGAGPFMSVRTDDQLNTKLVLGETYTCPEQYVTCTKTLDAFLMFTNGRGTQAFSESVLEKTKEVKSEDDIYYPIPFDLVLLFQTRLQNNELKRAYSTNKQANRYVKELLEDYYWQGGVAIGGTASVLIKENKLASASPLLALEATTEEGVIGVCLHDSCFVPQNKQNELAVTQETHQLIAEHLPLLYTAQQSALTTISTECFSSRALSTTEQDSCKKKLSTIGFSQQELFSQTDNLAQQVSPGAFYFLDFSSLDDDAMTWKVRLQAFAFDSCQQETAPPLLTTKFFTVHLPVAFKGDGAPANFSLLDKITLDDATPAVYLTTKTPQELCEQYPLFIEERQEALAAQLADQKNGGEDSEATPFVLFEEYVGTPHTLTIDYTTSQSPLLVFTQKEKDDSTTTSAESS